MDEVTQQNAALVEQAAAATASLNEQTFRLTKAMEIFQFQNKLQNKLQNQARAKPVATRALSGSISTLAKRPTLLADPKLQQR